MMRGAKHKGISGYTLVIVIALIIAILGLTVFWLFISHTMEGVKNFIKRVSCKMCMGMRSTLRIGGGLIFNCEKWCE